MVKYQQPDLSPQAIENAEHIDPGTTGDNIAAKTVAPYGFGTGLAWGRVPLPLLDLPYDYVAMSSPDGNGNYQTVRYYSGGSGGTLQRTLTMTYDAASNVTSIARS